MRTALNVFLASFLLNMSTTFIIGRSLPDEYIWIVLVFTALFALTCQYLIFATDIENYAAVLCSICAGCSVLPLLVQPADRVLVSLFASFIPPAIILLHVTGGQVSALYKQAFAAGRNSGLDFVAEGSGDEEIEAYNVMMVNLFNKVQPGNIKEAVAVCEHYHIGNDKAAIRFQFNKWKQEKVLKSKVEKAKGTGRTPMVSQMGQQRRRTITRGGF